MFSICNVTRRRVFKRKNPAIEILHQIIPPKIHPIEHNNNFLYVIIYLYIVLRCNLVTGCMKTSEYSTIVTLPQVQNLCSLTGGMNSTFYTPVSAIKRKSFTPSLESKPLVCRSSLHCDIIHCRLSTCHKPC